MTGVHATTSAPGPSIAPTRELGFTTDNRLITAPRISPLERQPPPDSYLSAAIDTRDNVWGLKAAGDILSSATTEIPVDPVPPPFQRLARGIGYSVESVPPNTGG